MSAESEASNMFRPPVNRSMKILDRSFFRRKIPTSAARILENKAIPRCKSMLGHHLLKLDRMQGIVSLGDKNTKALLLSPNIRADGEAS